MGSGSSHIHRGEFVETNRYYGIKAFGLVRCGLSTCATPWHHPCVVPWLEWFPGKFQSQLFYFRELIVNAQFTLKKQANKERNPRVKRESETRCYLLGLTYWPKIKAELANILFQTSWTITNLWCFWAHQNSSWAHGWEGRDRSHERMSGSV